MNELNHFISELSDIELAIFIAYKLDSSLNTVRKKILEEVKRRALDRSILIELFQTGLQRNSGDKDLCLRCNSDRLIIETAYKKKYTRYSSYDIAIESHRCRLCGYNPEKFNQKGIKNKLKKLFGFYRMKRLARPDIDKEYFVNY